MPWRASSGSRTGSPPTWTTATTRGPAARARHGARACRAAGYALALSVSSAALNVSLGRMMAGKAKALRASDLATVRSTIGADVDGVQVEGT